MFEVGAEAAAETRHARTVVENAIGQRHADQYREVVAGRDGGNNRSISFGPTSLRRGATAPVAVKIQTMGFEPGSANIEKVYEKLEPLIYEKIEVSEAEVENIIRQVYQ